jgi:hypothetical protein
VPFKAGNIVAANQDEGGNAGITLNKLIYMRALMASQFVDLEAEMPVMLVNSKQQKDLLKIVQVQSKDYNGDKQVLQSGNVLEFMGFKFVPCEFGNQKAFPLAFGLSDAGGGIRKVPCFVPSGMHWGTWRTSTARSPSATTRTCRRRSTPRLAAPRSGSTRTSATS